MDTLFSGAEERYVRAGGFVTRYLEAGDRDAQPVLLLHDGAWGGCSSVSWGAMIQPLAENYRVLAPDMLGFGGTDKVVFLDRSTYQFRLVHLGEFLSTLNVTDPVRIIGSSYGGSTALRSLVQPSPLRVHCVVSISGTGGAWRTDLFRDQLGRWDGSEEDLMRVVNLLTDEFPRIDGHFQERLFWARKIGHYRAMKAPTAELPSELRPQIDDPWPTQLIGCKTPVMLVKGERDELLESDWADHIKGAIPHAQIVTLDCKHSPNLELPKTLLSLVEAFMKD